MPTPFLMSSLSFSCLVSLLHLHFLFHNLAPFLATLWPYLQPCTCSFPCPHGSLSSSCHLFLMPSLSCTFPHILFLTHHFPLSCVLFLTLLCACTHSFSCLCSLAHFLFTLTFFLCIIFLECPLFLTPLPLSMSLLFLVHSFLVSSLFLIPWLSSHALTISHALTPSLTHSHASSCIHTLSHALMLTLPQASFLFLTLYLSHARFLDLSHSHSLSQFLSLVLMHSFSSLSYLVSLCSSSPALFCVLALPVHLVFFLSCALLLSRVLHLLHASSFSCPHSFSCASYYSYPHFLMCTCSFSEYLLFLIHLLFLTPSCPIFLT